MFYGSGIEGTIEHWNVGNVRTAYRMFMEAMGLSTKPELDLSRWNMVSCSDFTSMFEGSAVVDSGVGKWKLRGNADTTKMFAGTKFKGDLTRWRDDHRKSAMPAGQTGFGGRPKFNKPSMRSFRPSSHAWSARAHARQGTLALYAKSDCGFFGVSTWFQKRFFALALFLGPIFGREKR
jgi:hypothetical protein